MHRGIRFTDLQWSLGRWLFLSFVFLGLGLYVVLLLDEVTSGNDLYNLCYNLFSARYRECRFQAWDALGYMEAARIVPLHEFLEFFLDPKKAVLTGTTNWGIYLQGKIAYLFMGFAPQFGVFIQNFIIYVLYLRIFCRIYEELDFRMPPVAFYSACLDPWILFGLIALQKEIWIVFFVTLFILLGIQKRPWAFLVAALASAFFREINLVIAAFLFPYFFLRIHFLYLVVALSLILAYGLDELGLVRANEVRLERAFQLEMRSADFMHTMSLIQGYPFGHFLAGPLVFMWNLLSSVTYPLRSEFLGPGTFANALSALHMLLLLIIGGYRTLYKRARLPNVLAVGAALTILVIAVYPVSQYRYYLGALPVLILWAWAPTYQAQNAGREKVAL